MNKKLIEFKDYVIERRQICLGDRVEHFDPVWKQALENYDAKPFRRSSGTDLTLPEIYIRTEILLSHILADFMGHVKSPLIPFSKKYNVHQKSEKIMMLWEHRMQQMDFLLKMIPFFRSAILLGTGIVYVGWDRIFQEVRKEKPWYYIFGNVMGNRELRYNEITTNQPVLRVLDIMSCWVDPDAESCDIQKARDFGYDKWMTKEEVERYVSSGDFSEDARNIDWNSISSRHSSFRRDNTLGQDERRDILGYLPSDSGSSAAIKQVLVTEWWGNYDFGNGFAPCVCTVADPGGQNILLRPFVNIPRDGNNPLRDPKTGIPFRPFVAMNHITRDLCFWGRGLGEILYGLNEEYQEKVNLRLKNVDLAINGMLVYFGANIVNQLQLQVAPGNKIETKGPIRDTFDFLKFPDISQSISYQIAEIEQSMDEVSGVDAVMRSAPANLGGRTPVSASEIAMRQNIASRRFAFIVNTMMQQGPVKIAEMVLKHEKMNISLAGVDTRRIKQATQSSSVKVEYEKITSEDLDGEYDFFFVGDPLRVNENIYRNQKISAIGLMMNPLFAQAGVIKPWELAKNLCEAVELPWQEILEGPETMLRNDVQKIIQETLNKQPMMPPIPNVGQVSGGSARTYGPQSPAIPAEPGMRGSELPLIPSAASAAPMAPIPEEGGVFE